MQLSTSYKQILAISVPIMLGSAAQNIIVLSDNVFLYHVSEIDFAAVGLVGVFYLVIASIGYGFSRGGQIMIARRFGERNFLEAGNCFKSLFLFEVVMAIGMFLLLFFGSEKFFPYFIQNDEILRKCVEYIKPRSFGIFFSYIGVSIIAFYTGIAKTKFIIYDTLILVVVNVILNYALIFGKFGLPTMGISGAGLASTIAEVVAFMVFIVYMLFDKDLPKFKFVSDWKIRGKLLFQTFDISAPIVFQSILALGSWFIFFAFVEKMGSQELQISNLIRNVYLILSIPCWGYSAGINTMVSNFIGNRKRQAVIPLIVKTSWLNLATTMAIAMPVAFFPEFFLYPLFGSEDSTLIADSKPIMPIMLIILALFSVGATVVNGLTGTGHTKTVLYIQFLFTVLYTVYVYVAIKVLSLSLAWAWGAEILYWGGMLLVSAIYLVGKKWHVRRF